MAPKRPHYFQSQFLVVRDFEDEQKYHEQSLQQHIRSMHDWGVVRDGLKVKKSGSDVVIDPGSAIDSLGREIILDISQTLTAAEIQAARPATGVQDVFVTIAFHEKESGAPEDKYPPPRGTEFVTRFVQTPTIAVTQSPAGDGSVIILARIAGDGAISEAVRKIASSFIARGSNLGDISLDGTLSFTSKTSPHPTYPQVGLDFDKDQLRVRARSENASSLDLVHLTINRGNGFVGIGEGSPSQKLEVAGALKLTHGPDVTNDNIGAYFWDQREVGPTIAGKNFEVRTGGNSVSLRINNEGNVGVGTTSPESRLHVLASGVSLPETKGSSQGAGRIIRLKNGGIGVLDIGGANDKGFWLQSTLSSDLSTHYPLLLNPTGGNVGIGTTEPGATLEVFGALKLGSAPKVTPDASAAYFWNQGNIGPTIGGHGFEVQTGPSTPRLRISSTGNVGIFGNVSMTGTVGIGIGTPDVVTKLHVEGNGSAAAAMSGAVQSAGHVARLRGKTSAGTTSPVLDIGSAGDKGFWLQTTNPADLAKNYPLILNPNGGDIGIGANLSIGGSLGIKDNLVVSGNVGIGTRDPLTSLHIRKDNGKLLGPTLTLMNGGGGPGSKVHIDLYTYYEDGRKNPEVRIIAEDEGKGTANVIFQTKEKDKENLLERMRIDSDTGEVKVAGSISCGGLIGIRSAKWTTQWLSARGPNAWDVQTHGELKDQEEWTIVMSCSREFKENISDLTALEAITTLQNLTPVKYDYKEAKAFRQNLGFIAEDMPENLASEDRKSISPFEVVPILTRVAKEQQRVIAELQETVRTLQTNATKKHKKHKTEGTKTYGRATTKTTRTIEKGL